MKPILFNTEMVKAILDRRKTVTRRIVRPKYSNTHFEWTKNKYGRIFIEKQNEDENTIMRHEDGSTSRKLLWCRELDLPCHIGEILYVRETWSEWTDGYVYKVPDPKASYNYPASYIGKWHPSSHMPKEAARIFLKVKGVSVERLQDIDKNWGNYDEEGMRNPEFENISIAMQHRFISIWNSTIKKANIYRYGWEANPWVWVIEFERISKEDVYENTETKENK